MPLHRYCLGGLPTNKHFREINQIRNVFTRNSFKKLKSKYIFCTSRKAIFCSCPPEQRFYNLQTFQKVIFASSLRPGKRYFTLHSRNQFCIFFIAVIITANSSPQGPIFYSWNKDQPRVLEIAPVQGKTRAGIRTSLGFWK